MTDTVVANLSGSELDDYAVFVGFTPEYVAKVIEKTACRLAPDQVSNFTNTCLLAATGQRKLVETLIRKPNQAPLLVYLMDNFWINRNHLKNHLNFSALSLIGHCLMSATSCRTSNNIILSFQHKIRANSIWEADLHKCKLSYTQRRIYQERTAKHTKADADAAGNRIRTALSARVALANIAHRIAHTNASQTGDDEFTYKDGLGTPDIKDSPAALNDVDETQKELLVDQPVTMVVLRSTRKLNSTRLRQVCFLVMTFLLLFLLRLMQECFLLIRDPRSGFGKRVTEWGNIFWREEAFLPT